MLVKNDSTISGYHLYWLPDLGFLRFSLVDYRDAAEILKCDLLLVTRYSCLSVRVSEAFSAA